MRRCCQIIYVVGVVVLAGSFVSFPAQKREKKIIQGPVERSKAITQAEKQAPPLAEGQTNSEIQGEINRDQSIFEIRRIPQPPNSVRVEIRYNKEYGYKHDSGAFAGSGPQSFDAFAVFANPYGTRRPEKLIPITRDSKMIEAGGYYVCDYLISELPLDQAIVVSVSLANRDSPTEMWKGGSQPQPPPGQRRIILEPVRTVTLTKKRPSAILIFEMVYASSSLPKP